jgi:hypothetical protein
MSEGGLGTHLPLHLLIHARAELLGDGLHAAFALPLSKGLLVDTFHAGHGDGLPVVQVLQGCSYPHLNVFPSWLLLLLGLPSEAPESKPAKHPAPPRFPVK